VAVQIAPSRPPAQPPSPATTEVRGSEYAELSRRVRQAGLLGRRPLFYFRTITVNAILLAGGWVAFVLVGDSWWQVVTAAFLAVMFTQTAFLGHDAGHAQVFRRRGLNEVLGLVHGNLLVGLSYGWWISKHNRHHGHPNQVDYDPDVAAGVFVFTKSEAVERRGAARILTRFQAYVFFPMLLLEGLNLHVASITRLAGRRDRAAVYESVMLVAHLVAYVVAVALVLSPMRALVFVAIQQGLFGLYMGCSFAPNHKGMPMLAPDDRSDYLRRQVLTARNIRGGRFTDIVFGGLGHQIEHHLFPNMPRPNLRQSKVIIQDFCRERDVAYTETGVLRSYALSLRALNDVGVMARRPAGAGRRPGLTRVLRGQPPPSR
jgi:fatty acid desaturase